jgi:hypothetical protein
MEIEKLRGKEIQVFKTMLDKYKGYDFIDILIHKTLKCVGTPKEEFENREAKKSILNESFKKVNTPPQDIIFCDGDKCEAPVFKENC